MYFSSTDAVSVPNLEKYLREWGIEFANDMVLDSEYCVGTTPYMVIPQFSTEEIMNTGTVPSTVTSPIMPNSRSVNLLFAENTMYKTQSLISTFEESSYSKDKSVVSSTWDRQDADKSGPFSLAALSMKYKYLNNVQVQSYVMASGSVDMLDGNILTYSGNGEYIMQLYKLMVNEQDDTILAAQKSTSSTVVTLSKKPDSHDDAHCACRSSAHMPYSRACRLYKKEIYVMDDKDLKQNIPENDPSDNENLSQDSAQAPDGALMKTKIQSLPCLILNISATRMFIQMKSRIKAVHLNVCAPIIALCVIAVLLVGSAFVLKKVLPHRGRPIA